MGCWVSNHRLHPSDQTITHLWISNGAMDMLVSMLAISASELAVTEWQKRFASWICGFDTSRLGLGMACWDMDEIGWTRGDFAEQKSFVLQSIDLALQHHRWGGSSPSHRPVRSLRWLPKACAGACCRLHDRIHPRAAAR